MGEIDTDITTGSIMTERPGCGAFSRNMEEGISNPGAQRRPPGRHHGKNLIFHRSSS